MSEHVTEQELARLEDIVPEGATVIAEDCGDGSLHLLAAMPPQGRFHDPGRPIPLEVSAYALNALPRLIAHVRNLTAELGR